MTKDIQDLRRAIERKPAIFGTTALNLRGFEIVVDIGRHVVFRSANPTITTPDDIDTVIALLSEAQDMIQTAQDDAAVNRP